MRPKSPQVELLVQRPRSVTRRSFLGVAGLASLSLWGKPALALPDRRPYDIVVRHGVLFDGMGTAGREMEMAILDGVVAAIAPRIAGTGRVEIDARGMAVAPGFIDIHSHADDTLFEDPLAESVIRQGVTTVVIGQDGFSRAPLRAGDRPDPHVPAFANIREVLQAIDALPSTVNVASLVGLGTIRHVVIGDDDRPATPAEIHAMTALVESALGSGACGASTGLEYIPGGFASQDELTALCRPLAQRGLPYATHMRNEDDHLLEAIDEAVAIAHGAGCPLQISHLKTEGPRNWNKIDAVFGRIDAARHSGLDVAFDRYPYIAFQTTLANLFPKWSEDGGNDAFLKRLSDPSLSEKLRAAVLAKIDLLGGWDDVSISSVSDNADRLAVGQRLGSYAKSLGRDPYDVTVELLQHSRGDVGMVAFVMKEENLERILAHPLGMVCSDGGAVAIDRPGQTDRPHPRTLGTFPRVLGRYVREKSVLTLPQAIYKMTGFPASRLKLTDRGRLAPKLAADFVVFDPATVCDRATFDDPFQYPVGIKAVAVNGHMALLEGHREERRYGRALRPAIQSTHIEEHP